MRRPSIADFIEDELLRAPLLFDAVLDVVVDEWRQSLAVAGRGGGELARLLQLRRSEVLSAALRSLRQAVTTGRTIADRPSAQPARLELSLVDESNVVADLEIGRCAERVMSDAEGEFRDVHAYTSALVGDFAVSRETNPFKPEAFARAMWEGCLALPAAPAVQHDAFRRAIAPLARCVRSALAAACERLSTQGVEPATYRTLIFQPDSGSAVTERVHFPAEDLSTLRDSLFGTLGRAQPAPAGATAPAAQDATGDAATAQLVERVYTEICAEAGLPAQASTLLAELRPVVERMARRERSLIDRFDHPVWQFIDCLANTLATTPQAERARLAGLARNLVGHLVADTAPDAARFAWAIEKLEALDKQALAHAVQGRAEEIQRLARTAAAGPDSPALDVGALDTVPGAILDGGASAAAGRVELAPTSAGDRLRMFLQGEWRVLQLLWSSHDLWLLRDTTDGREWALRAGVVERLAAERLVRPFRMRSLARRAAERVQQSL